MCSGAVWSGSFKNHLSRWCLARRLCSLKDSLTVLQPTVYLQYFVDSTIICFKVLNMEKKCFSEPIKHRESIKATKQIWFWLEDFLLSQSPSLMCEHLMFYFCSKQRAVPDLERGLSAVFGLCVQANLNPALIRVCLWVTLFCQSFASCTYTYFNKQWCLALGDVCNIWNTRWSSTHVKDIIRNVSDVVRCIRGFIIYP